MSSSYRLELDRWLTNLDVRAERCLDIGGSQLPVKGRTKSWDVDEYTIADLKEPHVNSPKPDVYLDLNEEQYLNDSFDLVFCLEVFEYVWNPAVAIENISQLLDEDGRAFVTFQSVYPLHQPIEDDALRYMPAGIVKLAQHAELTIEQMIKRRPETDLWPRFFNTERMRGAKNEDHNFTGFIVEFKK